MHSMQRRLAVSAIAAAFLVGLSTPTSALPDSLSDYSYVQSSTTHDSYTEFTKGGTQLRIAPPAYAIREISHSSNAFKPSIGCTLKVNHVHPSHHVNGKINGTAKVDCTGKARAIGLSYSLIRVNPNSKQWGASMKKNNNKAYLALQS